MRRHVLIDTDAGVDDVLALILALRSPELNVEAITTVAGNVPVRHCTRNVLAILDQLHIDSNLIVAEGAAKPLSRRLFTAPEVHGADGFGNARPRRRSDRKVSSVPASRVIAETSKKWGRKLTIVALGPLTNIAHALRKYPRSLKNIGRLITMGGAFRVPGNTGPVAEFNYYVDPEAAETVLKSGLPITVVPLDLTQQVVVMHREMERRASRRANRLSQLIVRMTRFYMKYHSRTENFFGGFLHDPIAVACAIRPSLFHTQELHVEIETKGILTRGMSVADLRRKPRRGGVDVALKFDREEFLKLFHERIWS
jgi:purine nucleosidase/pyrimidine-specific ribonucleoside hydrolase